MWCFNTLNTLSIQLDSIVFHSILFDVIFQHSIDHGIESIPSTNEWAINGAYVDVRTQNPTWIDRMWPQKGIDGRRKSKRTKRNRESVCGQKVVYLKCMCLLLKRNMCGTSHLNIPEKKLSKLTQTRMEDKVRMRMRERKADEKEENDELSIAKAIYRAIYVDVKCILSISNLMNWARVTRYAVRMHGCRYARSPCNPIAHRGVHHIYPALHSFTLPNRIGMW